MLEHQILTLQPDRLDHFDFLLTQLNLKQAPGFDQGIVRSVLREGFSTTDLYDFIPEFLRKLARLNRVHDRITGRRTPDAALRDFIELSRRDCKLSLARYLLTPEEIVDEILRQLHVTEGVRDLDISEPSFVQMEMARAINLMPDFEAKILKMLCENSNVYWVSDTTRSEINSLVEYPVTTVVLVIKPPGSDMEFEIKRAGRRGRNSLNVVYARDGYTVAPSHRLDGGSMQYLLRGEARAASRLGGIYRLVHGTEAPISNYLSRSSIFTVPVKKAEVQTLTYFTEPKIFGERYPEMRVAMGEALAAFKAVGYPYLPDLPGDLGLTAQFIGLVAPTQAILSGTSSFRLNKLALYLSRNGPERYFEEGLAVSYSNHDARRLADAILEEILGSYRPPDVRYQSHEQYLAAAFRVAGNRAKADRIYLSLVQQIARFWGTLLAVRGYSNGESFVARNVGLKSFWDKGDWKVKIIFMDHDALTTPGPQDKDFHPHAALPGMALDERYVWGGSTPEQFATSDVGYLQNIYRASAELSRKGRALAQMDLRDAYKKTQRELLTNPKLQPLFDKVFLERLLDWDTLVRGYLQMKPDAAASTRWKERMRKMLAAKGYRGQAFDAYWEIMRRNRPFLERHSFLFDLPPRISSSATDARKAGRCMS
ncbi:MAG: hypothetical protein L0Y67_00050 [Gammaproteobacteria bacterium]|nr:hypothetical protein [Gammaproteobacteria bacterium]